MEKYISDWLSYLQHPGSEFHSRRTGGRDEETYPELYRRLSAGRETGDWWVWLSESGRGCGEVDALNCLL